MIEHMKKSQRGASLVHWILALTALLGFGALAIDLNSVYVSQAQLQNAADAGALEGARVLYCEDGQLNHAAGICGAGLPSANQAAQAAALENNAATWGAVNNAQAVEVVSVERGHWQFMSNYTEPNTGIARGGVFIERENVTVPADLVDADGRFKSFQVLNADTNEINAVRVVTARVDTPVTARFARLLGIESFPLRASSVAYIGFASTLNPGEVDVPIGLCLEYVTGGCSVGRMISQREETGGWTNLRQPGGETGACSGASSAATIDPLVSTCTGGVNTSPVVVGWDMQFVNGQVQGAFTTIWQCYNCDRVTGGGGGSGCPNQNQGSPIGRLGEFDTWPVGAPDKQPDTPWKWILPVVDCTGGFTGQCNRVLGAVQVDVLWMFNSTSSVGALDTDAPRKMTRTGADGTVKDWDAAALACNLTGNAPGCITDPNNGEQRWNSFVQTFDLRQDDGSPADWRQKSIYFAPDCQPTGIGGGTGGSNFGVRSVVPVLVF